MPPVIRVASSLNTNTFGKLFVSRNFKKSCSLRQSGSIPRFKRFKCRWHVLIDGEKEFSWSNSYAAFPPCTYLNVKKSFFFSVYRLLLVAWLLMVELSSYFSCNTREVPAVSRRTLQSALLQRPLSLMDYHCR